MVVEIFGADRTIIKEKAMHKAKILAIHCIDLRFQEIIDKDLQEREKPSLQVQTLIATFNGIQRL